VSQHGPFPGRPRGRRARPDNDVPEWAGYDAVPQDQRDTQGGRVQGGYPPNTPGQAPWQNQPWSPQMSPQGPSQGLSQASQASPQSSPQAPQRHEPHGAPQRHEPHGASDWPDSSDAGADADPMEAFSERWHRRGSESRKDRRADRRKRRRMLIAGGGVAAVVIAVAVYFLTGSGGNSANLGLSNLVTTFLPGELQQVPNTCTSVPPGMLSQYLPGQLKTAAPPLNTGANSQCTWTLDKPPVYRVLEVNMQAYSPSGLASGDGSATFAAEDAYAEFENAKQKPGPNSGQPKATVTDLSGMPGGNQTVAFQAAQVFTVNGATTDVATVVVRYRNVIVTVVMNDLDHANKGNYGPASPGVLSSAAQTIARQVTSAIVR
jgi:hypothetical protein